MTELIWDSKYKDGKKVGPVRIELPFQAVETVNESAQQRQLTLDMLFAGRETEWRNRLIWGDKKYVLPSLLPEFASQVNLIYIPPFATGADFSFTATIPESDESFTKEPNIIEQKAYRDTWGRGLDGYLQWFYETAMMLHELLKNDGSMYIHCDWRVDSSLRLILDEIFGSDCYRGHIIWRSMTPSGFKGKTSLGKSHDDILYYSKNADIFTYNPQLIPYDQKYLQERFSKVDESGRYFKDEKIGTATTPVTIERLKAEGRIYVTSAGTLRIKHYLDEAKGYFMDDLWMDIPGENSQSENRTAYPTQKPEALLERIIKSSSNEGDLVLDCFCGSGTTPAVAEKLGRKWIACDLGRFAIHTTRKRLLSIDNVRPFVVQNLGKYERQAWQVAEFSDPIQRANIQLRYRNFILQLYHATPIDGYTWIHGIKGGRLVHVGSVDAPIALGEVKAIVNEFWRVRGKDVGEHSNNIDILGWDLPLISMRQPNKWPQMPIFV